MKAILSIFFAFVCATQASLIPLEWDAPDGGGAEGYAVWVSTGGGPFEWKLSIATLQADLTGLAPGTYAVYVTATLAGVHSDPSNTINVTIPAGPKNLKTRGIALMESADLMNWHAVAFYDVPEGEHRFYKVEFASR
jgi:hypothetical protein